MPLLRAQLRRRPAAVPRQRPPDAIAKEKHFHLLVTRQDFTTQALAYFSCYHRKIHKLIYPMPEHVLKGNDNCYIYRIPQWRGSALMSGASDAGDIPAPKRCLALRRMNVNQFNYQQIGRLNLVFR
jgi:hypothetical protein